MTAMLPIALIRFGNEFDAIQTAIFAPKMIDRLVSALEMANHVDIDASDESKFLGDTIRVAKPVDLGKAKDHPTDNIGSVSTDIVSEMVDMKIDRHLYVQVEVSDAEWNKCANQFILPSALEDAVDSLGETVDDIVHEGYKEFYTVSGDPASKNSRGKEDLIEARKALNLNKVSRDRMLVLHPDTEADMLLEFSKINESGDANLVSKGLIAQKYGFDMFSDIQTPYHFSGTASANNGMTLASVGTVGSTNLAISGTSGATFKKGDILYITGSPQSYVVTADTAGTVVGIYPSLVESAPAGSSVRVLGDHPVDLAFHKSASKLLFRSLSTPTDTPGVTITNIVHPRANIPLRMLRWYEPRTEKSFVKIELLCGFKVLAPERGVRMGKV